MEKLREGGTRDSPTWRPQRPVVEHGVTAERRAQTSSAEFIHVVVDGRRETDKTALASKMDFRTIQSPWMCSHDQWKAGRYHDLVASRALAQSFLQQTGHFNVQQSQGYLGGWVYHQRSDSWIYSQHHAERRKRARNLDDLHFNWGAHGPGGKPGPSPVKVAAASTSCPAAKTTVRALVPISTWDERLDELVKYKTEHGHCNVPKRHERLGRWVDTQRSRRKQGKLSEVRVKKLDDLGFNWGTARGILPTWDERYEELKHHKLEHGTCNISQSQGPLGDWVHNVRRRRKKGKISEEQIQRLDDLGFSWGTDRALRGTLPTWDERLDELRKYKTKHGNCSVPQRQGPLGQWVSKQRYRKDKLSEKRVQKLDDLGFNWGKARDTLPKNDRLEELSQCRTKHGQFNVP